MDINQVNIDAFIIQKYKEEEDLMIRLFIQWCHNHEVDPHQIYQIAYPEQQTNQRLQELLLEAEEEQEFQIDDETMFDVLQIYGNDALAFVMSEVLQRIDN